MGSRYVKNKARIRLTREYVGYCSGWTRPTREIVTYRTVQDWIRGGGLGR